MLELLLATCMIGTVFLPQRTSWYTMHLVLDEEVHQRNQRPKESTRQVLSVLDGLRVGRTQRQTSQCPRQRSHQIADHEDVVPIVIIRARNICPSSTCQSSEDTHTGHELGKCGIGSVGEAIPQEHQRESWTRAHGDEDLEDGSFGVAIANCCAYGGEPFDWVAKVLVLDNLVVMQRHADYQSTKEGGICGDGVQVRDVLSRNLENMGVRELFLFLSWFGRRMMLILLTTATTSPSRCLGGILWVYASRCGRKGKERQRKEGGVMMRDQDVSYNACREVLLRSLSCPRRSGSFSARIRVGELGFGRLHLIVLPTVCFPLLHLNTASHLWARRLPR